jgi:hypothetical protein
VAALNPADLLLPERPPVDHHPAEAYLANRTPRSRDATRKALDSIASLLTAGQGSALTLAWHLLDDSQVTDIRRTLMECYPAAVANRMLAALRGVSKTCWRLGLMDAEAYRRVREAAAPHVGTGSSARALSRGEVRSIFESCADDGPPAVGRVRVVRALLQSDGPGSAHVVKTLSPPHVPAPVVRGRAMTMTQLSLRRAAPREAIAHALWEADVCLRQRAFCACLAMLRKALDLWSAEYRDTHGLTFNRGGGERDDVYWRLRKIAGENKLFQTAIDTILDSLTFAPPSASITPRDGAHDGEAEAIVCRGGSLFGDDGLLAGRTKESYRRLHEMVVHLIASTAADLPI